MNNSIKIMATGAMLIASAALYAAQPKLMVLPDKTWATQKGYIIESTRNGKTVTNIDYDKAFVDPDFNNVKTAIQQVMAERGFPIADAQAETEGDADEEMIDEAFEGAQSGAGVQTN